MPRTARTISASGYYHIIARGIGKQILFEEDEDYLFFLRLMKNYSSFGEFSVTAFCLMENHVHILAKIADGMMDKVMHNLLATYATYYNMTGSDICTRTGTEANRLKMTCTC